MTATRIRLVLADVDRTMATSEKKLTDRAINAVHRLYDPGIRFAITSRWPPRGTAMFVEPLTLQTPIAAFSGGVMTTPGMTVIEQHIIPGDLVVPIASLMRAFGLDVWISRGADWTAPTRTGHMWRARLVQFHPKIMARIEGLTGNVAKIVGVSDDHDAVAKASAAARDRFGDRVTAAPSQRYYPITRMDG